MNNELELITTQWFDPMAIRLPAYKVGRINHGRGRSYIKLVNDELESPFQLYTSLTTVISQCAPMERPLLEWYCKLGLIEADRQSQLAANYGTLMHILFGEFLRSGTFDFEAIDEARKQWQSDNNYWQPETDEWTDRLRYDIAAFIKFSLDYEIKPLGVEYVLVSEKGYGTLIDLVCELTLEEKGFFGETYKTGTNAGQPKETKRNSRIRAIINFKSGRHAFYRTNGLQVECERLLWNENFPDLHVDYCFNWSPKDWDYTPSYNFKNWSGEIQPEEIEAILLLAKLRFGDRALNKKFISIGGQYYSTHGLDQCINIKDIETWCKEKYSKLPA